MFMRKEGQKKRTMHENGHGTMMMRLHINGARYDVQLEPRVSLRDAATRIPRVEWHEEGLQSRRLRVRVVCPNPADTSLSANTRYNALGSVSKVEMVTPTALIYKV